MQPLLKKEFLFTTLITLIPNSLFTFYKVMAQEREATSPGSYNKNSLKSKYLTPKQANHFSVLHAVSYPQKSQM